MGDRYLKTIASGCDIAKEIPKYRLYEHGELKGEFQDGFAPQDRDLRQGLESL